MTAIQHLDSADGHGRALRALRSTTHVLRLVGDHVESVTVWTLSAIGAAVIVNGAVEFAPVLNISSHMAILLILAVWGAARLVEGFAYDVADWIDPDVRDGDSLWVATKAFEANVEAITEGANYDDIRLALQASAVVPALYRLTEQLRDEYAGDDEMDEAAALGDTAALLRAVGESLGHHDISQ